MKKQNNPENREYTLFDAKDQILGRLCTEIANTLRGKNKPQYDPAQDLGDHVVVINASQIAVTGKKMAQKKYYRHSGYLGNLKEETLADVMKKDPSKAILRAVYGMLPDNKLKKLWLKRLYIFNDENHPYKDKVRKSA